MNSEGLNVTGQAGVNRFEERLETELVRIVAVRAPEAPAVRQRAWRRPAVRLGAVAGVAAAAVVAPLVLSGGGAPAYAVVKHPDGSLSITVNDTRHPVELQRKLKEYGVNSKVMVDKVCRTSPGLENALQDIIRRGPHNAGNIIVVDPRTLPSGALLTIGVSRAVPVGAPPGEPESVETSIGLVQKGDPVVCSPVKLHVTYQPEPTYPIPPTPSR
jgi:hypothetical protein